MDADKAGLERVDDAVVDDAVDTTPDGLEEEDFVTCRVATRSAVALGDVTFAIVLVGVFVMIISMCDEGGLEKKVCVKHSIKGR